jgi:hypothetical protein
MNWLAGAEFHVFVRQRPLQKQMPPEGGIMFRYFADQK